MRKVSTDPPSHIDGNNKPEERFADVYEKLYNAVDDCKDMKYQAPRCENLAGVPYHGNEGRSRKVTLRAIDERRGGPIFSVSKP